MNLEKNFDVIVIGAGHAGCEAAAASARSGVNTALITNSLSTIGEMSCNPAIGGLGKGHLVREIDALDGIMGIVADQSGIQFRLLNSSRGHAVRGPRTQSDRELYKKYMQKMLISYCNLNLFYDPVTKFEFSKNKIISIETQSGNSLSAKKFILTTGTFLNGLIHIGDEKISAGRIDEKPTLGLSEQLKKLNFKIGRLKTGTPPRLDGTTINYEELEMQDADKKPFYFSYLTKKINAKQISCGLTYTNDRVHKIIEKNINRSAMYSGSIKSIGPRYCPSIEDKIVKFKDKQRHQIFLEPESLTTNIVYPNGISTSLPKEIQQEILFKINGLENVRMIRPGYAIEYDYVFPTELDFTLKTKKIENLYLAGQINGTTGYEEAACQGLMAGINAHNKAHEKEPLVLKRSEAYIGVLIDDLITKGTEEPYRMFTSRAEFRTLLRQDNADFRLTEIGYKLGLASEERNIAVKKKKENVEAIIKKFNEISIEPTSINAFFELSNSAALTQKQKLSQLILRPGIAAKDIIKNISALQEQFNAFNELEIEQAEIQMKYAVYIEKEKEMVEKMGQMEGLQIPDSFDFGRVQAISTEAKEKLKRIKPRTLGQASRISGINPSDVQILMVYMGR